jgi:predicted RNA-binding protein associated with RNAse of E/G family
VALSNENKPNSVPNTSNQENNKECQHTNVGVPAANYTNNNLVTVQKSNKIRSTIDTANTPSGTYLNLSTKNIRNLYNNLPTPPSSMSNLPSESNPE